jgi:hypothetical protein
MSEKVTKYASITAVKAVVCSFFIKLSKLSGGGGNSKLKPRISRSYHALELSILVLNLSHRRNFSSWTEGFY